jgi:hypothetical protein
MDGKIIGIYNEFQRELKLNQDTIDYGKRLHEDLMEKNPFKYESPYLIAAICIFTVSRIAENPKTLTLRKQILKNAMRWSLSKLKLV